MILHALDGVADDEPVHVDRDRQPHVLVLGDAVGHDRVVVGLLGVLGKELDPAAVAHAHAVGVVAVDVEGRGQRPVHQRHQDRQAVARGDMQHLPHEGKALGAGGGRHAAARGRCADAGAHGAVLALHEDRLGIHLAVRNERGERFHDARGRRDGIRRHDIGIQLAERFGNRLVAGDRHGLGRCYSHVICPPLP